MRRADWITLAALIVANVLFFLPPKRRARRTKRRNPMPQTCIYLPIEGLYYYALRPDTAGWKSRATVLFDGYTEPLNNYTPDTQPSPVKTRRVILSGDDLARLVAEHQGEAFSASALCEIAMKRRQFAGGIMTDGTPAEDRG